MNTIVVRSGESIRIQFSSQPSDVALDRLDDGAFEVHYDTPTHKNQLVVKEVAGLPGSKKGGANEILYLEQFGPPPKKGKKEPKKDR